MDPLRHEFLCLFVCFFGGGKRGGVGVEILTSHTWTSIKGEKKEALPSQVSQKGV